MENTYFYKASLLFPKEKISFEIFWRLSWGLILREIFITSSRKSFWRIFKEKILKRLAFIKYFLSKSYNDLHKHSLKEFISIWRGGRKQLVFEFSEDFQKNHYWDPLMIFRRSHLKIFLRSSEDLPFKSSQNFFEIFVSSLAWIFRRFLKNLNVRSSEYFPIGMLSRILYEISLEVSYRLVSKKSLLVWESHENSKRSH